MNFKLRQNLIICHNYCTDGGKIGHYLLNEICKSELIMSYGLKGDS